MKLVSKIEGAIEEFRSLEVTLFADIRLFCHSGILFFQNAITTKIKTKTLVLLHLVFSHHPPTDPTKQIIELIGNVEANALKLRNFFNATSNLSSS